MSSQLQQERIFVALTRPQMFAGVTYNLFIANCVVAAEAFLIFKSFWVILLAAALHVIGVVACLREPRFFDLWIIKVSRCPRVRNYRIWGCNSYTP